MDQARKKEVGQHGDTGKLDEKRLQRNQAATPFLDREKGVRM